MTLSTDVTTPPRVRPLEAAAAGLLLLAFWLLMLASLQEKSITADEIAHVTAGYTYWKFHDYRMNPENGNLPQRIMALPLVLADFPFPSIKSHAWYTSDEWWLGFRWFHRLGNDAGAMLWSGRAASGLMAVVLGAVVWSWSRRLFGLWGGLLSLLLYVLNPTILANGALMTSDTTCALFFLGSTWSLWCLLHRITVPRVLVGGLVMGGLFVSKMSALLILPLALVLLVARLIAGRPLTVSFGPTRELTRRGSQALAFAIVAVAHAVLVLTVIWASYGFRFRAFAESQPGRDQFSYPWEWVLMKPSPSTLLDQLGLTSSQQAAAARITEARGGQLFLWSPESIATLAEIGTQVLTPEQRQRLGTLTQAPPSALAARVLDFARRHALLPEAYVYGYAHAWKYSRYRAAFFNGQFSLDGWHSFFPYTFLVKTPLALFALLLLALFAWISSRPVSASAYELIPLLSLAALYWAAVVGGHLNIGHRHILTTYPPLFILGGAASGWIGARSGFARALTATLVLLLLALAGEMAWRFPNYLAYFNGIVRPSQGYRHLVDSSLDWGQDLPGVKRYLEKHPPPGPVYLSYFGNGSPAYYGIRATQIYSYSGWDLKETPPLTVTRLRAGEEDALADFQARHPDYDVFDSAPADKIITVVLLKKAPALRLTDGTYFISASMLQPVTQTSGPWGPWNLRYEGIYQQLRKTVAPLLADDPAVRGAALSRRKIIEWQNDWALFDQFRFARLTAWLRRREPDDNVNFSILVYHLSDEDIAAALDGPPAELGRDLPTEIP